MLVLILIILVIGAIAGWLAGVIMQGRGFGFLADAALGIIGAFVGSFIFGLVGVATYGLIGGIIKATIGAVVVLALVHALRGRPTV
jgi:uncharacterized membrane protein YeaQ/YmgE (transglycosylase-associated protein family)